MKWLPAVYLGLLLQSTAFAQMADAAFQIPASACISANTPLINQSLNADRYEWDFCQGDLSFQPAGSASSVLGGSVTTGIDIVFDGTNWFGFVTSQNTNSILRLDFGSNINSAPTVVDLGNISGHTNLPTDIKIITENGNWYGIVYGLSDPLISRINFGSSLANTVSSPTPITADVIVSGAGSVNGGFDVMFDGSNWIIVMSYYSTFSMVRLPVISGLPSPSDLIVGVSNPFGSSLGDIVLQHSNGNYYGYVVAFGNKSLQRLSFGGTLFSAPTIDDVTLPMLSGFSPYGIDAGLDNGIYYLMVSTLEGFLLRVDLGSDLSLLNASGNSLGNFALWENTLKIKLLKHKSSWVAFSPSWNTTRLYRTDFPGPSCNPALSPILTTANPVVSFATSGPKAITLRAYKNNGEYEEESKVLSVTTTTAPPLDITFDNYCLGSITQFQTATSATVLTYNWDLGDLTTSTSPNPTRQYANAGSYLVTSSITTSIGCNNYVEKLITIYNPPIPDFVLPSGSPTCTNQDYLFNNTSTFDPGSGPAWEWRINGNVVSTQSNLHATFSVTTPQTIMLSATIPGCAPAVTKMIPTILTGPSVDFNFTNDCSNNTTPFTNATTGADQGFTWDFGDGTLPSNAVAPNHQYMSSGVFQVTLTGSNSLGCNNTLTKAITIYSLPQPNFSIDLPPFSCSNVATPFINTTPPLSDSNITGWDWQFGDASPNSNQKFPAHTYSSAADYTVVMTATSDVGCIGTLTKVITIAASPVSDFVAGPACLNQITRFTDLSSGGVSMWDWQIASTSYAVQNPTHMFTSPGNYPVSLTVTSANGCSHVKSLFMLITTPPALDFSMTNACADQVTEFNDITPSNQDPVVGWNWNFDGNAFTGNPSSFDFPLPGTFNVKMTTTHQSGCKYTLSRNVVINSSPIANFTATPDRGEAPLTVQFQNESTQADSYLWRFYDKIVTTSTSISPVYTFAALGSYSASLTAISNNGCVDQMTLPIEVLTPTIDLIMKEFALVADPITGNLKVAVTIMNNSNMPINTADVEIQLSADAEFHEVLTINLKPGEFIYKVLASSISAIQNNLSVICAEIISEKDIQQDNNKLCLNVKDIEYFFAPYPNPTSGALQVDWVTQTAGTAVIRIFDSMGKRMFEWSALSNPGLNQTVIDVAFLGGGMYFVTIDTGLSKSTSRFVRQ